jgi:hypothetical protein
MDLTESQTGEQYGDCREWNLGRPATEVVCSSECAIKIITKLKILNLQINPRHREESVVFADDFLSTSLS